MTTFRGFRIKGIDEERVPDPREAQVHQVAVDDFIYDRYTVYLVLEPIRDPDENQDLNIDSNIKTLWGEFFTKLAEKWIDRFKRDWDEWPQAEDMPLIQLKYCDNGDYGEIHIEETYFEEVETWNRSLKNDLVAVANEQTLENLAERESLKEEVRSINSRCFSDSKGDKNQCV